MTKNLSKKGGEIYTPANIVSLMLDFCNYNGLSIYKKHIIDNSCGKGAFLEQIVQRYCSLPLNPSELQNNLETYIHGIEINENSRNECIDNLNRIVENFGLENVKWDIKLGNALTFNEYDRKMDYVVGNPPYVRIHNLKDDNAAYDILRKYEFAKKGSSDLYLAFYELGLRMLKPSGSLCYISPSAWLQNASGLSFRHYINNTHHLSKVIDFGSEQIFDNAQTYVMIAYFQGNNDKINYYEYNKNKSLKPIGNIKYEDIFINDKMYFISSFNNIKEISNCENGNILVKNGFATLSDEVFIDNVPDNTDMVIPIYKSSKGIWKKCLFPYDNKGNGLTIDIIKEKYPIAYEYIQKNEEKLKKRSYDKNSMNAWWLIGRRQGINDVNKNKVSINNVIKNVDSIKTEEIPAGTQVYSGYYIMGLDIENVDRLVKTVDFIQYVKSLKKYKSGGYFTFSPKDLQKFLNWKCK